MAWKDLHHQENIMDKSTITKLAYLSKLSIPEGDIKELSQNLKKGRYEFNWGSNNLSNGIYTAVWTSDNKLVKTIKMIKQTN